MYVRRNSYQTKLWETDIQHQLTKCKIVGVLVLGTYSHRFYVYMYVDSEDHKWTMEDNAIKSKKMRKQRREGQKLVLPSFILRSYTLALLASNIFTDGTCLAINSNHPNNNNFKPKAIISRKDGLSSTFIFRNDDKLLDCDETQRSQHIINGNENTKRSEITKKSYSNDSNNNQPLMNKLKAGLRSTFLPSGYPQKTPKGYLSYSAWSWIQDLSTQLRGVLATQRVLEGVGVGREGATALSASLNFIVRDGCGMASTLIFTALSGSRFRSDVKRWRMFADLINGMYDHICELISL